MPLSGYALAMASPPMIDAIERVIHTRRTHKAFTGASIPRATIERLLELARWAPTHRLTEPWRFHVLEQPVIIRLMDFLRARPEIAAVPDPVKGPQKLAKLLERLPQAGALIMTTWLRSKNATIDLEDHAAAAAAVQNLLLGATAHGLGSYWSTTPALAHPLTQRWCGIDMDSRGFLGCIWLGYPATEPPVPPRRPVQEAVSWVNGR
jgi:nitroreductase